jgi:hypothetical protein
VSISRRSREKAGGADRDVRRQSASVPEHPTFWQNFVTSLWAPETYLKITFLIVTSPFWWPTAKGLWVEIKKVLYAEPGAPIEIARHEDPFLNIPLAAYRASRRQPGARTNASARAAPRAGARLGPARRSGF